MALEFYKKSTIPEFAYYKAMAPVAVMNYKNTAMQIFKDKVNKDNIDVVLEEWHDYKKKKDDRTNETVELITDKLNELK